MSVQQGSGVIVSSTVTKQNPRPRKYATASERQAAYRARAPEVCFRAEAKTVETLDNIAQTIDQSRADLLLSMTKFALANHDWARFGLTHRPLPYGYGVQPATNPAPIWKRKRPKSLGKPVPLTPKQKAAAKAMAKAAGRKYPNLVDNIAASRLENPTVKKPTPAQLAARARFAEMARSGAFKRKAKTKAAPKAKTSAGSYSVVTRDGSIEVEGVTMAQAKKYIADRAKKTKRFAGFWSVVKANPAVTHEFARIGKPFFYDGRTWKVTAYDHIGETIEAATTDRKSPFRRERINVSELMTGRRAIKANPAKKTVSEKISQLVREGYPQKQAVAVALSEERAGKVKRNPIEKHLGGTKYGFIREEIFENGDKRYRAMIVQKSKTGVPGEVAIDFFDAKSFKTKAGAERFLENYGRKPNPATGAKKSRTKLNPVKMRDLAKGAHEMTVTYAVHWPDRPSYQAMAYYTKKSDAVEAARDVSDRYEKPIAVSRVQTYFGPKFWD